MLLGLRTHEGRKICACMGSLMRQSARASNGAGALADPMKHCLFWLLARENTTANRLR